MKTIHLNEKRYFALSFDEETGEYYLSIPINKGATDYSEYYLISKSMVDSYPSNIEDVEKFVSECRKGNMFHLSKDKYSDDYLETRGGPWIPL